MSRLPKKGVRELQTQARNLHQLLWYFCHKSQNLFVDIDECVERFNDPPCRDLALCTDLEGSYECGCREGYTGNGTVCNGESFIGFLKWDYIHENISLHWYWLVIVQSADEKNICQNTIKNEA